MLWLRTNRRFGACTTTLRPCREDCVPSLFALLPGWGSSGIGSWGYPFPALIGGQWYNLGCGSCQNTCSCTWLEQVELPYPVSGIGQVKVDGVVLAPSAYRVDDWRWLVRIDGGRWPTCQDLTKADTEVGTWSVTASYGEAVPELGRFAVNELALEIARGCVGSTCKLSSATVSQLNRQGVTKEFMQGDVMKGQIGLYFSDLFINTYNPFRSHAAAIFDVDGPRARRVGT